MDSGARRIDGPWQYLSLALFAIIALVMLLTLPGYDLTWDEQMQREYAGYILN